jgi:hypothetical protein
MVPAAARQFDFDANVQSGTPDLKVQEGSSSTRSCPTPCPTGIFDALCLHLENDENPVFAGLS